eukprot:14478633-Ditylum_brightwellii.AAC.1
MMCQPYSQWIEEAASTANNGICFLRCLMDLDPFANKLHNFALVADCLSRSQKRVGVSIRK